MRELYDDLQKANPELAKTLGKIYDEALEIWQAPHLRTFTAHGQPHILQVERNLDALTRPLRRSEPLKPEKPEEIFVLLAACYLHDIGMQLDVPDAREEHAQHSYELILHSKDSAGRELHVRLSLADNNAREAIAKVARGHWTRFALELPESDFVYGNEKGRLRLLGVLLAMADLLDVSPVRDRYFQTFHRLFNPDPTGCLHHAKHERVRGFEIGPAAPEDDPGALRFALTWRDDSEEARLMSDWLLHWLSSEWRRLEPSLKRSSGGAIRWGKRWATIVFEAPIGPLVSLGAESRAVLEVERAEQLRIDRDAFAEAFRKAVAGGRPVLFILPGGSEGDGKKMSEWCAAVARRDSTVGFARLDVRLGEAPDLASIVADVMEQWGEHLPECDGAEARERLESMLTAKAAERFVTVIVVSEYWPPLLGPLLESLFTPVKSGAGAARVCVLLSADAEGPEKLAGVDVERPEWLPITQEDLRRHLRESWGLDDERSAELAEIAEQLGLPKEPGKVYTFVHRSCVDWSSAESAA